MSLWMENFKPKIVYHVKKGQNYSFSLSKIISYGSQCSFDSNELREFIAYCKEYELISLILYAFDCDDYSGVNSIT